ncbi:MAG: hypothetical protein ABSE25_02450 [Syntrophorhabdales bacterium]|jgi:hypothetical protein
MKRIVAAALLVVSLLSQIACATPGRQYDEEGRQRPPDYRTQEKFQQERSNASNPGGT